MSLERTRSSYSYNDSWAPYLQNADTSPTDSALELSVEALMAIQKSIRSGHGYQENGIVFLSWDTYRVYRTEQVQLKNQYHQLLDKVDAAIVTLPAKKEALEAIFNEMLYLSRNNLSALRGFKATRDTPTSIQILNGLIQQALTTIKLTNLTFTEPKYDATFRIDDEEGEEEKTFP